MVEGFLHLIVVLDEPGIIGLALLVVLLETLDQRILLLNDLVQIFS